GDADFPPRAAQVASRAFTCLAESEAAAHGCSVQQVHFHEVGAIDSIIDICAGALAIALLEVERVYIGDLPWSQGTVSCAHGLLTVPVPAVRHLLTGFQFESSSLPGELITPTGAAMLVAVAATQESPGKFRLLGVGGGGGHKDLAQPNILYGALGEPVEPAEPDGILLQDEVVVITTNMDDATGELLGMLWEQLPSEQILDISYGPLLMKKARPAWQLTIIAVPGSERKIAQLLFEQTSTNGVRIRREQRLKLPRRIMTTTTVYGDIEVKLAGNHIAPEYESVKAAAIQSGAAYQEVYLAAVAAVWEEQHERVDL
ncbi:MAG: LarC family nickel insertion protein, partial [Clostridiales bacterium]